MSSWSIFNVYENGGGGGGASYTRKSMEDFVNASNYITTGYEPQLILQCSIMKHNNFKKIFLTLTATSNIGGHQE